MMAMLAMVLVAAAPALAQSQSNSATFGDQYAEQSQYADQFNAAQSSPGDMAAEITSPETTSPENGETDNGNTGNGESGSQQNSLVEFGDQVVNQIQAVFQSNFFGQSSEEE